jgi:Protein of unknown function (DUF3887)
MTPEEQDLKTKMEKRAQALVDAMAKHKYGDGIAHLNAKMASLMPAAKLEELWKAVLAKEGDFVAQVSRKVVKANGAHGVALVCKFARGTADIYVTFDASANISGLHFGPAPGAKPAASGAKPAAPGAKPAPPTVR